MEKTLYWLVENNGDLSTTTNNLTSVKIIISEDFESWDSDEKKEVEYTITPTYLTQEEYLSLPEN